MNEAKNNIINDSILSIDDGKVSHIEILSSNMLRASVGETFTGKIVTLNDKEIPNFLSNEEFLSILSSSSIDKLCLDTKDSNFPIISSLQNSLLISFRKIKDGKIGAILKGLEKCPGFKHWKGALEVFEVSSTCTDLSVGDVIIAINDFSIVNFTVEHSIKLLLESSQRKLTIIKKEYLGSQSNNCIGSYPIQSNFDSSQEYLLRSSNTLQKSLESMNFQENLDHENENSNTFEKWKSIRRNYLCRNIKKQKPFCHYQKF